MVFFTICSRNFFAYALTLRDSLFKNHGSHPFYVALCDELEDFDNLSFPFQIIHLSDLGIPSLEIMKGTYNIIEFNTAIKPFVFGYLFEKHPGSEVIYLDPDIFIISEMTELKQALAAGADCVLTPHLTEPAEFAEMDDQKMLLYGIYNLGFCALRDTSAVRRVVSWWGRRLELQCVINLPEGLFVDQKWADLFPAFIENTRILRHPGYNVAYWNLSQRRIRHDMGSWYVNNQPLRFLHFSGLKLRDLHIFSRHSKQFNRRTIGDLGALLEEYEQQVTHHGCAYYKEIPYAYSWNGQHGENLHTPAPSLSDIRHAVPLLAAMEGRSNNEAPQIPHLPILRCSSLDDYRRATDLIQDIIKERHLQETQSVPADQDTFELPGYCVVCGKSTQFQVSYMYCGGTLLDGRTQPNFREHLNCLSCGFVNRLRASFHIFFQEFRPSPDCKVYITEQSTPAFAFLKTYFRDLIGSEYLSPDHTSGATVNGIRHEDLQALSFAEGQFDYVLSFDVLEHVPHEIKAFREIYRCLKPGGYLFFTVPFRLDRYEHEVRARLRIDGTIEHLLPPQYHGNPVDSEQGSLCFRCFGWQTLEELEHVGFKEAQFWTYWSRQFGYLGEPQLVIIARKT
jgi:SAM-dependent methyltransferase